MSTPTVSPGLRRLLVIAVFLHLLVAGTHGVMHQLVPVPLTTFQTVYVGLVVVLAPLVGAALVPLHFPLAAVVVFASMLASLLFGVVFHFVLETIDNVWCVPPSPWRPLFVISAIATAASELFGTAVGALATVRAWRAPSA